MEVAIDYFGCVPFMYASDIPHEVDIESCKHKLEELTELKISEDTNERICDDTARTFYRL